MTAPVSGRSGLRRVARAFGHSLSGRMVATLATLNYLNRIADAWESRRRATALTLAGSERQRAKLGIHDTGPP